MISSATQFNRLMLFSSRELDVVQKRIDSLSLVFPLEICLDVVDIVQVYSSVSVAWGFYAHISGHVETTNAEHRSCVSRRDCRIN